MTSTSFTADAEGKRNTERAPSLLARLRRGFADWIADICAEPEVDPTAAFTSREWADMPVHHPACEDEAR